MWNCEDDTRYRCTHKVTNDALRRVSQLRKKVHEQVLQADDAATAPSSTLRWREKQLLDEELAKLPRVQKQMVQYHGKWVFVRIFGAQEPLSVLFSLMNLWVHIKALTKLKRQLPDVFPLKLVYLVHALLSSNAWLWSAVFHTRDKPITEKLDYFSAASVLLSALFFTLCRLFRLNPGSPPFRTLLKVTAGAYIMHILYLTFSARFDYGYNMAASVTVGLIHLALWAVWSARPTFFSGMDPRGDRFSSARSAMRASKPRSGIVGGDGEASTSGVGSGNGSSSSHTHAASGQHTDETMLEQLGLGLGSPPAPVSSGLGLHKLASVASRRSLQVILLSMLAAGMLELLDFAPLWRAIDAHCLWHLATVPITLWWYDWLIEDGRACVGSGWWIGEPTYRTVPSAPGSNPELVRGDSLTLHLAHALLPARTAVHLERGLATLDARASRIATGSARSLRSLAQQIDLAAVSARLESLTRGGGGTSSGHERATSASTVGGMDHVRDTSSPDSPYAYAMASGGISIGMPSVEPLKEK